MELISVQKIWNEAPHNAFTDLIRFNNEWLCIFREGDTHLSVDGVLRILRSNDAKQWIPLSLIVGDFDLRDGKFSISPDNQLMVCGAEVKIENGKRINQSVVWFSKDGRSWSKKHKVGDLQFWLWRMTWHENTVYSMAYHCEGERVVSLYSSKDGMHFSVLAERLIREGEPTEASLLFDKKIAYCLLRRDDATGLIGSSLSPYTHWEWNDLGVAIGGPHFISIPDSRFVAAVRLHDNKVRTSLCFLNPQTGEFREDLELPSGGDTSYPGLVWHQERLWVSYYSSHEGNAAIYFAEVRV